MNKECIVIFVRICISVVTVLAITCITYSAVHHNLLSSVLRGSDDSKIRRDLEQSQSPPSAAVDMNRTIENDYFMKYWNLERSMRFDFNRILEPCKQNTVWRPSYPERTPYLITSAKFCSVQVDIRPAGQYSRLLIQSFSSMNTKKSIGGDSWRVLVNGDKSVPVTTIDNLDGTYEMSFLLREAGYYNIDLYLEYTLCDGFKDPPPYWYSAGDEQGKYQPENTLEGNEKAYLEEKYETHQLSFYVQDSGHSIYNELQGQLKDVSHKSCLMWDGFGEWNNQPVWFPSVPEPYKRKSDKKTQNNNGILWIYGDSVGRQFYTDTAEASRLCRGVFRECKLTIHKIYNEYPGLTPRDGKNLNLTRIEKELEDVIQNPEMLNNTESAILINYGLHFAMDIPFSTFIDTIERIAKTLERYTNQYKGTFIWKTTSAMNKWKFGYPDQIQKHGKMQRFLTEPRIELFNAYSTWRMCQSNINTLDIFPMTSSYPFGTGTAEMPFSDSVHFGRQTFMAVENYLIDFFTW